MDKTHYVPYNHMINEPERLSYSLQEEKFDFFFFFIIHGSFYLRVSQMMQNEQNFIFVSSFVLICHSIKPWRTLTTLS